MHSSDGNPSISMIEELIGAELLGQLSRDLGGRLLYIAATQGENSVLAESIGLDAAKKIAEAYGGMTLKIPLGPGVHQEILDLHRQGMKIIRISHKLKRSISTVSRVIHAAEDDKQTKLFD